MAKSDFLWRSFQSKPVERIAFQLTSEHDFEWDSETKVIRVTDGVIGITAACHQDPQYGDFIVKLDDNDVYHCSRSVFADRNYLD